MQTAENSFEPGALRGNWQLSTGNLVKRWEDKRNDVSNGHLIIDRVIMWQHSYLNGIQTELPATHSDTQSEKETLRLGI